MKDFLNEIAEVKPHEFVGLDGEKSLCYFSKVDGSYLTHVAMEDHLDFLLKYEITEQIQNKDNESSYSANIGFSPANNKWYGWSHRAIHGFTIGSECVKGQCHYRAENLDEEIERAIAFWSDEYHEETWCESVFEDCKEPYILINWKYAINIPNKELRGAIGSNQWYYDPNNWGRGEWIAESMEDAKQMACDFAEGVS